MRSDARIRRCRRQDGSGVRGVVPPASRPSRADRHCDSRMGTPADTAAEIQQAAHNPAAAPSQLRAGLAALHKHRYALSDIPDTLASFIASNPGCPPALLGHLAGSENPLAPDMVAYHPACPSYTLARLTAPHGLAANVAAGQPNLPAGLLGALSRSPDEMVRAGVAYHPECPVEILESLAGDVDYLPRCASAANPRTPVPVLRHFAAGHDNDVLESLALNTSCPPDLFEELVQGSDRVVAAAAANPSCPLRVLRQLASGDDPQTRGAVLANPSCPAEAMHAASAGLTVGLAPAAANPNCPPEMLDRFAVAALNDRSGPGGGIAFDLHDALIGLVSNPSCSPATLTTIARTGGRRLRIAVCESPNCPPGELVRMVSDPDSDVAVAARRAFNRVTRSSPRGGTGS